MRKQSLGVPLGVPKRSQAISNVVFSWLVPVVGFQWQRLTVYSFRDGPEPEPCDALVPREPDGEYLIYNPMDDLELFATFASLPYRKEDILSFANQYGTLTTGETYFVEKPHAPGPERLKSGDTLQGWLNEIQSMRHAIDLWSAIQSARDDSTRLRRAIEWRPAVIHWHNSDGGTTSLGRDDPRCSRWREGDRVKPANYFLADKINRGLLSRISPQIVFGENGKPRRSDSPANLLGVLWYQLYTAFTGETKLGRCAVCGEIMPYIRSTRRMHPNCSNKIRKARFKEKHSAKKTRSK